MPSPNLLWSPRQVLQISNDGCCVGYAPSKGRKCRIGIAGHNLFKAHTLLDGIAQEDPDADALRTKLHNLAGYMLCVRWHQSQARDMVDKWVGRMKSAYPYGEVVVQPRAQNSASSRRNTPLSSSASSSPAVSSRRTISSASSVSLTTRSERESSEESNESLRETIRFLERRLAELDRRPSISSARTSPAISHISTSNTSALDPSRSSTLLPSSSVSTTRPQAQASTSPRSPASASATRPQVRPSISSSASSTRLQVQASISSPSASATPPQAQASTSSSSASSTRPQAQASTSSSSAIATPPQARASIFSSSTTTSAIRSPAQTSTTSSDRSTDTIIASSTSRTHSHVRQRAIDDECHICMDDFLSDDLIMWCKAGCGRSVHQNCFETWETQCVASSRDATCAICRTAWESQSAVKFRESSASCTRTHVRRLNVDDECPICQEDYKSEDSLVWCKDGCGRVVHRDCFQEWQAHLSNSETSATCAFCRKAWVSNCECDA